MTEDWDNPRPRSLEELIRRKQDELRGGPTPEPTARDRFITPLIDAITECPSCAFVALCGVAVAACGVFQALIIFGVL